MRHMDFPAICLGKNWVLRTEDGAHDKKKDRKDTHGKCVYEAANGKDTKIQQRVDEDGEEDRVWSIIDERKLAQPTTSTSRVHGRNI